MRLEWIDGVPDHWKVAESQFVLDHQKREVQDDDEIVTAFRDGQVTLRSKRRTDGFTMADKEIGYQHICEGDLVVHSMDGGFGAIGVSDSCGKASPVVHAYTSDSCDLRFISYQLRSAVNAGWIAALAKGIRVRSTQFDRPALAGLKIAYPSLESQQRIADYLDRETAEIDAAVADLDRYVGLLEKRRNLVITDAVTSADSVKLAHLVRFGNGQDWRDVAAPDGEFPVYGSGGEFGRASDFIHDGEAVLFGRKGTVNRPIYVDEKFWTVDTMYYAVPYKDKCVGKYLYYWATTIPFETITTNTALPSVTSMDLSQLYVPLPPLESQQRIADYLDRETTEIDSLIAESIKLRDLLLKRRSVLITEVVTGRKQV
jgi:type I restriction enzyme S subunit